MTTAAEKLMQNLLILVLILLSRIDLGKYIPGKIHFRKKESFLQFRNIDLLLQMFVS